MPAPPRLRRGLPLMAILLVVALFSVVALVTNSNKPNPMVSTPPESQQPENMIPPRRGEAEGVSLKSFRPLLGAPNYSWTKKLLAWQKTGFHFQPKKNWMNGQF
ncbi:UNVERIFIED_CONTAM: Beta-fructofuranosidase 1 [Sesamum latifolium]|uniref:beta-fructofuranosidase n=1 Tax=Sesamum latifolium TaxID=2727402 RepID=A0AAW2WXM3_9LAMI